MLPLFIFLFEQLFVLNANVLVQVRQTRAKVTLNIFLVSSLSKGSHGNEQPATRYCPSYGFHKQAALQEQGAGQ